MSVDVLKKVLNQEFESAFEMACYAGLVKEPSLSENLLAFAMDELRHASEIVGLIQETNESFQVESLKFQFRVKDDIVRSLIYLVSEEDTAIHYYEDIVATMTEPYKGFAKRILEY